VIIHDQDGALRRLARLVAANFWRRRDFLFSSGKERGSRDRKISKTENVGGAFHRERPEPLGGLLDRGDPAWSNAGSLRGQYFPGLILTAAHEN
jgi:hypothetical protein